MGDLDKDTRVEAVDGAYRGEVSPAWRLIGPSGGQLSALALRAALASSAHKRPASYVCHYLNAASEGEARLDVQSLRSSKRAESLRVSLAQAAPVLEALVWTVAGDAAVDHDTSEMPAVEPPLSYRPMEELAPGWPPFNFWSNVDYRPILLPGQEPYVAGRAALRTWTRFRPAARFDDPAVAAARLVILADVFVYPAASMAHAWPTPFWASSLDLAVTIHDPGLDAEWLLVDADAPIAADGLIGGAVRIWSEDGRLLASSVQQMLQRPRRPDHSGG